MHSVYFSFDSQFEERRKQKMILFNKSVFELLVLYMCCSLVLIDIVETRFKIPLPNFGRKSPSKSSTASTSTNPLPSTTFSDSGASSSGLSPLRQRSKQTSASYQSLTEVSLYPISKSSSSLNIGKSPSIMQESTLHQQAAQQLNAEQLGLLPKQPANYKKNLQKFGIYVKNTGIGFAAVGGAIQIERIFSRRDEKNEKFTTTSTNFAPETTTSEIVIRMPK